MINLFQALILQSAFQNSAAGSIVPDPPTVANDVQSSYVMRFISAEYPNGEIEVMTDGGDFQPQPEGGYPFGDSDLAAGYFAGRIRAAKGRKASEVTSSPAFTKKPELATGRTMQPGSMVTGDSIAANHNAEDGRGFVVLTFGDLNITDYTNLAVAGETVTQQTKRLATAMPLVSTVPFAAEDGVNSFKKAGDYGYDNTIRDITSGYISKAAMLWAKHTYFMNEFTASNPSGLVPVDQFLDTFGTRCKQGRLAVKEGDPLPNWFYKSSAVAGETISKTVSGTGFAILYYKSVNKSRIQVTCDNMVVATTLAGTNSDDLIEAVVIDDLKAGNHNLVIAPLDPGKTIGIDCVIALKTPAECADIPFYVIDTPNLGDGDGLGLSDPDFKPTSNTEIDRGNAERFAKMKATYKDRPLFRVTLEGYDPNDITQTNDKLHPLSKGHRIWANNWLSKMKR